MASPNAVPPTGTIKLDLMHQPRVTSGSAVGATTRLDQHCAIGKFVTSHPELALCVVRHARESRPDGGVLSFQPLDDTRAVRLVRDTDDRQQRAELERHYLALFEQAATSGELSWREHGGFVDFACSLDEGTEERLFIVGRECAPRPLDYRVLEQAFATLAPATNRGAADFADFVRCALSRPVKSDRLVREIADFCEIFRAFMQEAPLPSGAAASSSKTPSTRPPRPDAGLIAIAAAPIDAARAERDPLRARVDARRLLHEAQSFASDVEGAVAVPLEDYGVLLTIPVQGGAKALPKADTARKLAERLRQFAHHKLSLATVVGTAVALAEPESRDEVAQRAVLALRRALENGQAVFLLEDMGAASKAVRHSHVLQALERLSSTFERQAMSEAAAMTHGFVHAVSCFSGGRLDIVRLEFVLAVTQVAKAIQRRYCLAAEMPERWGDEAALRLDACSSLEELSDELKRTLHRLAVLATSSDGPNQLRIEELLDYLRNNLAEPVKLPHLARRTGFSVPSFCRVFKRATGRSLLTYVRGLRIDRAKHLLATTELPNTSVAELSGFHSQHHFIRSFKKVMRSTPGEYRRAVTGEELQP